MPVPEQPFIRNRLLQLMPAEAYQFLAAEFESIDLNKGDSLLEADTLCVWVYFPESGLGSVVTVANGFNRSLEVGLFGRDGMSATSAILGASHSPHRTFVQLPGTGHRVPTDALQVAMQRFPGVASLLLRYVQAFLVQVSQTALSNASFSIEDRLARWLLLTHDRVDGDDIALTHEFLSTMLGVRRTGVTLAIQMLEGRGLIRARRGIVTIVDRLALEGAAVHAYGQAEREYERLIGPLR